MPKAETDDVQVFGIRHHGPGSARSVLAALKELKPDCILVEGPPEADSLVAFVEREDMKPPVALLIYSPDNPKQAVYYPFAQFSPEWQAIRYGVNNYIPVKFMDLPMTNSMALEEQRRKELIELIEKTLKEEDDDDGENHNDESEADEIVKTSESFLPETKDKMPSISKDPLSWLARAANVSDGERWWEQMVEQRRDTKDLFAALNEAMSGLRESLKDEPADKHDADEPYREAHMRQTIRQARKDGYKNIAVICGAWHTPALSNMPPAAEDAKLLKGLPKTKVVATWIPWTHSRLSYESGYGAGIVSPGWYQHLWDHDEKIVEKWMSKVARFLRDKDLDASSAHIIETVRLAETLAAMRGHSAAGLSELNEATKAVLCFGDDTPLKLIYKELIIGDKLGEVPAETQGTPLAKDLEAQQKSLRMKAETGEKILDLDLRKDIDRGRSHLLHRLSLLGIKWGIIEKSKRKSGTFHEVWNLRWEPEFSIALIEASVWGRTVLEACEAKAKDQADKDPSLQDLTELLDQVLLADLTNSIRYVMEQVKSVSATASDISHLMHALMPLAQIARYGNVRKTDVETVSDVIASMVARICAGLPAYCSALNDDAAQLVFESIIQVNSAISLLNEQDQLNLWYECLQKLLLDANMHGLISGRAARLLLDAKVITTDEIKRYFGLALSLAQEPGRAASFAEGFLQGSGLVLIHDVALLEIVDSWVSRLSEEQFKQILPLMRRTFSSFTPPERRQIGERIKQGQVVARKQEVSLDINHERGSLVLPTVALLLGLFLEGE
ncbi:MAG: DUF5682 family protein [Candidatus Melainabacteria bacterium]|nr:DUF5682 family protein [Candidatus Melainabacteria bacterium]